MEAIEPIYKITVESFIINGEIYNVALSPVLYHDDGALDFTGAFTGLLIHPLRGTQHITLVSSGNDSWEIERDDIDIDNLEETVFVDIYPIEKEVITEISKIINKIKAGTSKQY